MKIAVLTGGGDCPGLNAVLRAIVRKAPINGDTVLGIRDGWLGAISGDVVELGIDQVRGREPADHCEGSVRSPG